MAQAADARAEARKKNAPAPIAGGDAAPRERGAVLARIRSVRPHLNRAERKVADFVAAHSGEIMRLTITEAAFGSGVSEATVLRLCRRLGLRGYQDFKIALAREAALPSGLVEEGLEEGDAPALVLKKVFGAAIQTLRETLDAVPPARFEAALDLLDAAPLILFCGVGTSAPIVHDAYNKFFRLGLPCRVQPDPHLALMEAALLGEGAVVFAVSHSGSTKDPVDILRVARGRGARAIAVTQSTLSPLGKVADIVLPTASPETRFRAEALASRIAQTAIVNALFVAASLRHPERSARMQQRIEDAIVVKQF